jgi:hypothetical protein
MALIWSITLGITVWRGYRQDYIPYMAQWDAILSGSPNSAYSTSAYGPFHNFLAFIYLFQPLLPKVIMVLCYLIVHSIIIGKILGRNDFTASLLALSIFPFNFTFISIGASLGNNDALVASFVGMAILLLGFNKPYLSGVLLGLGVLLKFYPILLAPYFVLKFGRNAKRFILCLVATILLGMFVSFILWGSSIFKPFVFGSARGARMFSFLGFLDRYSSLHENLVLRFLIDWNSFLVIFAAVICFVASRIFNWDPLYAAALGLFICLAVYKVGNSQFYLTWLTMLLGIVFIKKEPIGKSLFPLIFFAQFLSIYQLGYELTSWYLTHLTWVREYLGLIAAIPMILTLAWVVKVKPMKANEV